ncbi:unnamed protein product [Chrysodeixis includens]|uniref:Uncharacterized protein n=1 Tax=Chrysodeixis includens TaxID=689277 RepID=A0A9N8PYH8_CHRIL|nr:unnamed protein product [Chrysodeixis includens]
MQSVCFRVAPVNLAPVAIWLWLDATHPHGVLPQECSLSIFQCRTLITANSWDCRECLKAAARWCREYMCIAVRILATSAAARAVAVVPRSIAAH